MKNLFIGLFIGLLLSGIACFLIYPNIKQAAYDSGFEAGNKKGISTGTASGITQGMAQLKAEQKQQRDGLAMVEKNKEAQSRATHRVKKVAPPLQNWHVINGQIDEPVVDTSTNTTKTKGHKKAHKQE